MNAWLVMGFATLSVGLGACGGKSIDYGSPNGGNPGSSTGLPTFAQGSDWQILPAPALGMGSMTTLVGSGPSDVWAAGSNNGLYHCDGQHWVQVTIGPPASTGDLRDHMASAGPGAVWIAHAYGVVRVDTSGAMQDYTAQIAPQPTDELYVDASADMTVVTDGKTQPVCSVSAFTFDGTEFVPLPAPFLPGADPCVPGPLVRSRSDVWITANMEAAHYDGSAWQDGAGLGIGDGVSGPLIPFAPGKAAQFEGAGSVCPDWCHPSTPPHGATRSASWTGSIYDAANLNAGPATANIPAPTDLDPSLAYAGIAAEPAADGALALVGCAFGQKPPPSGGTSGGPVPYTNVARGSYVVHEWDGQSLHARALTSAPACSTGDAASASPIPSTLFGIAFVRPLTDGTWILPAPDAISPSDPYERAQAVLIRP